MASTRYNYDKCRTSKNLQQSSDPGRYMLNTPGPGLYLPFFNDPQVRMQKWGANLMTNTINLESDLMGLTRPINRDFKDNNEYTNKSVKSNRVQYPSMQPTTEQPRATHPAWTARDLEQVDWYTLPLNPQENTCIRFENNISTRIIQKDNFVACPPNLNNTHF